MDRDDGVDVRRVAAAHRDDDRQIARAAGVEHDAIALAQPVDRELQPPEPIAFVRIGAGQIEDEVRPLTVEHAAADARSSAARYSSSPAPSSNVTSRSLTSLRNGKFFAPCSEKREDRRVVAEDRGRAVALVDVAVDDGDARD